MGLTKPVSRSSAQDQIGELIGATEMMIGKWYDPISQRWIVPREERPVADYSQSNPEKGPESSQHRARRSGSGTCRSIAVPRG